jgi:hypothetical protein
LCSSSLFFENWGVVLRSILFHIPDVLEFGMPIKDNSPLDEFLDQIARLFAKATVEATARETKFVQRESKLTGHLFLITDTFAMSIYANPTLEQLTALLDQVLDRFDEEISRVSLHQRINLYAVQFFEAMLAQAIRITLPPAPTLKLLKHFGAVLIVDSTSFQVPATLAYLFRGSGGHSSAAAIKIRFGYDLKSGRLFYTIQEGITNDNQTGHGFEEEVHAGSLRITDLGFFNSQGFAALDAKGAYFLSRLKTGVTLYQRTKAGAFIPLDLLQFVRQLKPPQADLAVAVQQKQPVFPLRLVVEKVPATVVRHRIRRKQQECQRKGRAFSPAFKGLASVNMYITNVPKQKLPSHVCRVLYAMRWQIELIFKLWKSNFALERVAGIRSERVLCSLYAKLVCIFVTSKLVFWTRNYLWNTRKRELSEFRASKVLQTFFPRLPRLLSCAPSQVTAVLYEAVEAMLKQWIKSPQTTRRYPLQMLDEAFS